VYIHHTWCVYTIQAAPEQEALSQSNKKAVVSSFGSRVAAHGVLSQPLRPVRKKSVRSTSSRGI